MQKTIHSDPYRALLEWLKAHRKSKGLTMRALAERLDVPHTWMGKVEQAERRMDILEFVRICKALDVSPHEGLDLLLSSYPVSADSRRKKPVELAAKGRRAHAKRS